jgi:hypothetical protein
LNLKISYPHSQKFHYLTASGKYITPNNSIANPNTITGALTTTTIADWISTPNHRELALNFTIQAGSGTLDIYLDVLDPIESQNKNYSATQNPPLTSLQLDPTQIAGAQTLRVVIANGVATALEGSSATVLRNFNVPFKWQVRLVIGGSTPSFSITATYEARE